MKWDDLPGSPSAKAVAYLADPANRRPEALDLAALPAERAEGLEQALKDEVALCRRFGLSTAWIEIAGIRCLEVTPQSPRLDIPILYLFGGGFISGGPLQDLQIIGPIAARTQMRVIAPDYRLAPEHPFPAALQDVQAVAQHLATTSPYLISGESAGGNLALAVTQTLFDNGMPPPVALALMSPAADLTGGSERGDEDDPSLRPNAVMQVSRTYAAGRDLQDPALSPIYGTFSTDWPATMISTGTRDHFLAQCQSLAKVIKDAGAETHLRIWPGLWHVFEYYPDIPEAALSLREIADFLNHHAGNFHD